MSLPSPYLDYKCMQPHNFSLHGFWELNSAPYAHKSSTSLRRLTIPVFTEQCSQVLGGTFYNWLIHATFIWA